MRPLNKYALYDVNTGKRVFTGTAQECVDFCEGTISGFATAYKCSRTCTYKGYRIELVKERPEKVEFGVAEKEAAKRWDEFVTPIREYYGIPVYRPGKR